MIHALFRPAATRRAEFIEKAKAAKDNDRLYAAGYYYEQAARLATSREERESLQREATRCDRAASVIEQVLSTRHHGHVPA